MTILNRYNIPLETNGNVLIGSTGIGIPTATTLTAGSGISVTNAANSITIANTGGTPKIKYFDSTTPNTTISTTSSLVSLTLPANTANTNGDLIEIGGEVVVAQTSGTFTGNANLVTGSTTSSFYNSFSAGAGKSITYSFYGFLIRKSSSAGFLASQCTGVYNDGTPVAFARLTTTVTIDFTNNATLGTSLIISTGSGTATQRMLWIRVTGK